MGGAFRIADLLLNCLTRILRGKASKVFGSGLHHDQIANLAVRIDFARILQENFGAVVKNFVRDLFFGKDSHGSLVEIEINPNPLGV